MDYLFISVYGKFVTSQTVSYSRTDINLSVRIVDSKVNSRSKIVSDISFWIKLAHRNPLKETGSSLQVSSTYVSTTLR